MILYGGQAHPQECLLRRLMQVVHPSVHGGPLVHELTRVLRVDQGPLPHVVLAEILVRLVHSEGDVAMLVEYIGDGQLMYAIRNEAYWSRR